MIDRPADDQYRRGEDAPPLFVVPHAAPPLPALPAAPAGAAWAAPEPEDIEEAEFEEIDGELEDARAQVAVARDVRPEAYDDDVLDGELVPIYRQALPDRPLLPVWLSDPDERRLAVNWATSYAWAVSRYHLVRSPWYAARIASYTPRGLYRAGRLWGRWAFDAEARPLRQGTVERGDDVAYTRLTYLRNDRVKLRLQVSGAVATSAVVAAAVADWVWPAGFYALVVICVTLLGWIGRPVDRVFIERAVLTSDVAPRLEPSTVVRALGALGNAEINKALKDDGEGVTFAGDPVRDGPGWRADIDLPFGVTARDVIAKRSRLASGLRRNIGCVWPSGDPDEHEGRLVLWVGDKPLRSMAMPPWPLLREGRADIFRMLPFGVDVRGRPVDMELIFQNLLIGAIPRQGKTFSLRLLLLGAALDPIVKLLIHELKGTGDLAPLRRVAHRYSSGIIRPAIKDAYDTLLYLRQELERRTEVIKKINARNPADCPENKVTRALAANPAYGLEPIVCAIDEAQNLFGDSEFGEEAADIAEMVIKIGPACGVILILATQKPNAKSLPTGVRSNVVLRFALRVKDQDTNDMILGTSQYKQGNRATQFSKKDLGIGLLLGETDEPLIVRCYYIDNPSADAVIDRALAMRRKAGTVTGVAAGEVEVIEPSDGLPEHLAAAWSAGQKSMWLEELLPRIAQAHPELYADWSTVDLGNACRAAGIDRKDVGRTPGGKKTTRRGIYWSSLQEVIAKRAKTD